MNTATRQTSPAPVSVSDHTEEQSTLGVVQKLQQKLRNTRENLERLRVDRSSDEETLKPHIISEKIATQLRLVNQERAEVLQLLGATGNEKLRDVVSRMQQELEELRHQNESLQSRPKPETPPAAQAMREPQPEPAPKPVPKSAPPAPKLDQSKFDKPGRPEPTFADKPKSLAAAAMEAALNSASTPSDSALSQAEELMHAMSPDAKLDAMLDMLEAESVEDGINKLKEMRDLCNQFPQQKESLLSKNQELTRAVKKMHADQLALCKRFNVNSLSDMARLIIETMDAKKQNANGSATELNSWMAVADLLQQWDKKMPITDPNHTVKIERTGSRWNLSANWLQK
ncbi:MAG: hypothetical protein CMJ46_15700 [Planctomyces sp.]|nr:hypothetical protein [Planctomyces sp.]